MARVDSRLRWNPQNSTCFTVPPRSPQIVKLSPLIVKRFFVVSALFLCVRKENICVVIIYLTQRAQRTQSLYFPAIHTGAGDVASFTTTGERRGRMTNEYSKQPLVFCQPLRSLVVRSQRPLQRKCCFIISLRSLRSLRAERKHLCGGYMSHAKSAESAEF